MKVHEHTFSREKYYFREKRHRQPWRQMDEDFTNFPRARATFQFVWSVSTTNGFSRANFEMMKEREKSDPRGQCRATTR